MVDELGGTIPLDGSKTLGVGTWVRLGYIQLTANELGDAEFLLSGGDDKISQNQVGELDWNQVYLDTASIEIYVYNHAPVAVADTATTTKGIAVTIDALANDTDQNEDDVLTLVPDGLSQPEHGTAEIVEGKIVYAPVAGYSGTDTFTYTIVDWEKTCVGTITVTINNTAPIANEDSGITHLNKAITIDALVNDTNIDNDELTITETTGPASGTVAIVENKVVYTPNTDFYGVDSFTYTVSDGCGEESVGTIKIIVLNLPESFSHKTHMNRDLLVDILGYDSLTISSVSAATSGLVRIENNQMVYTPTEGKACTDTFTYTVTDGVALATGTVTVTCCSVYDVNMDGTIDAADDALFSAAWKSKTGDENWNALCDFDLSGRISTGDYAWFLDAYGKSGTDAALTYSPEVLAAIEAARIAAAPSQEAAQSGEGLIAASTSDEIPLDTNTVQTQPLVAATINATTINAETINAATINAATINAATINAATVTVAQSAEPTFQPTQSPIVSSPIKLTILPQPQTSSNFASRLKLAAASTADFVGPIANPALAPINIAAPQAGTVLKPTSDSYFDSLGCEEKPAIRAALAVDSLSLTDSLTLRWRNRYLI